MTTASFDSQGMCLWKISSLFASSIVSANRIGRRGVGWIKSATRLEAKALRMPRDAEGGGV